MGNSKSLEQNHADKTALIVFLRSSGTGADVQSLWDHFDKNKDGTIEYSELRELAYHLLVFFWETTTPNKTVPKRDQLRQVIDKICNDILDAVDDDNNQEITRNEFDEFGRYAMTQWKAVEAKMERRKDRQQNNRRANKRRVVAQHGQNHGGGQNNKTGHTYQHSAAVQHSSAHSNLQAHSAQQSNTDDHETPAFGSYNSTKYGDHH